MWGGGSVFGGSGGSGGAGGGGGADGVSIPYYNQNFELLYKQMVTDGTTGVVTTSFLTAQPNEVVNTGTETDSESGDVTVTSLVGPRAKNAMVIGDAMLVWDAVNNAIKVVGRDGSTASNLCATGGVSALGYGPGGGGGGASALTDLVDVAISSPTNGQVLMYNASTGKWYNGTVQSGGGGTVTSITAGTGLTGGTITTSGTIALSQETQTNIGKGVTAYGWGDHAQAGYLKSSAISDMATKTWVGQQGYLTAASGTFWGKAWSNGGTVSGSLAAGNNGGIIEQFHAIELNNAGSLSGYGGYIDFHYNGSAADYTTRLIESEAGVLLIQAKNSASPYGDKVVGLKVGSGSGGSVENLTMTGTLKFSVNGMDSTIYADNDGYLHIDGNEGVIMGNDLVTDGYSIYTHGGSVDCGSGYMKAARFYVGTGRYIYLDGTTLKYNDNGTVKTIVLS